MESCSRGPKRGPGSGLQCSGGSVSCSVCLEAVADKGDRSIAKLKCSHQFHLDCIGSAFNAKGAMQCPNCRNIENGQWLYANGCNPYEDIILENFTNNQDLYDVNHTEMPFGFRWHPYQGSLSQLSVSLEEIEPPAGTYSDMTGNALYGEHSNGSTGSHLYPYLAIHGSSQARQLPIPVNSPLASTNPADIDIHNHNEVSGLGDRFGSHTFPAVETHHRNWHTTATFPTQNGPQNVGDPATRSHERLRLPMTEPERLQSNGSLVHFGYSSQGSYLRTMHGNAPPAVTTNFSHSHNPIQGPHGGHVYNHPQSVAPPLNGGFIAPSRRSRPMGISLVSSGAVQHAPPEQGQIHGPSIYGTMRRQDGDSMRWRQDHRIYGQEREGFPRSHWHPVDRDSHWRASRYVGQNNQNMHAEPVNRNYHPLGYIGEERGI